MTITTTGMTPALQALQAALEAPRRPGVLDDQWRRTVGLRMEAVRGALLAETRHVGEGWLAAREGGLLRERTLLLNRLSALGPRVLESPDPDAVRSDLRRLLTDVAHHLQRLHDLAYDEVELELGGSE